MFVNANLAKTPNNCRKDRLCVLIFNLNLLRVSYRRYAIYGVRRRSFPIYTKRCGQERARQNFRAA